MTSHRKEHKGYNFFHDLTSADSITYGKNSKVASLVKYETMMAIMKDPILDEIVDNFVPLLTQLMPSSKVSVEAVKRELSFIKSNEKAKYDALILLNLMAKYNTMYSLIKPKATKTSSKTKKRSKSKSKNKSNVKNKTVSKQKRRVVGRVLGGRLDAANQTTINNECGQNPTFVDNDVMWDLYKRHLPHDIDAAAQRCAVNPFYTNEIVDDNGAVDANYIGTFNDRLQIEGQYVQPEAAIREWEQINVMYNAKCIQPGYLRHEGQCFNKGDGVPGEMTLKRFLTMFKQGDTWPETWPTAEQMEAQGVNGMNLPAFVRAGDPVPNIIRVFVSCYEGIAAGQTWPNNGTVYQNLRGQPITEEHTRICGHSVQQRNIIPALDFAHMNIFFAFSICLNIVFGAYLVSPRRLIAVFCIFIPLLCGYHYRNAIQQGITVGSNIVLTNATRVMNGVGATIRFVREGVIMVRQRHQTALIILHNAERPRTIRQGYRVIQQGTDLNAYARMRVYLQGLSQEIEPNEAQEQITRINEQIMALQNNPIGQWANAQAFIADYRDFVTAAVAASNNNVRIFACPVCATLNFNAHCTNRLAHHFPRDPTNTRNPSAASQLLQRYGRDYASFMGEVTDNRCPVCNYFCPSDIGYIPLNRNAYDAVWNGHHSLVASWTHGEPSQGYYVLGYPGTVVMDPGSQTSNRLASGSPNYDNIVLTREYTQRILDALPRSNGTPNERITYGMIYGSLSGIPVDGVYDEVRRALQPQLFGWSNDLSRMLASPAWDTINGRVYEQVVRIRAIYVRRLNQQMEPRIEELRAQVRRLETQPIQAVQEENVDVMNELTPDEMAMQIAALEAFNQNIIPPVQIEAQLENLQGELDPDPMNEEEMAQLLAMAEEPAPAPVRRRGTYAFIVPNQEPLPRPPPRRR